MQQPLPVTVGLEFGPRHADPEGSSCQLRCPSGRGAWLQKTSRSLQPGPAERLSCMDIAWCSWGMAGSGLPTEIAKVFFTTGLSLFRREEGGHVGQERVDEYE